jgi:16S rRNA pseudouridine516 synthase
MQFERILQSQGLGTRRDCRYLVRAGFVEIAGKLEENPFAEFDPTDLSFVVDGEPMTYREKAYVVLNKPAHHECSQKPKYHPSVYSLFPDYLRNREIQAVGRLDEDTTGLLICTDDGNFIHALTSPKKMVDKVYEVTLKHPASDHLIAALTGGVKLHDVEDPVTAVACTAINDHTLHLTIREGRYHQVKRMVAAASNRVEGLRRIQIGRFLLPDYLGEGEWAWLENEDLDALLGKETV